MKKFLFLVPVFAALLFLWACKKTPDMPPVKSLSSGTVYTVEQLKALASCTNACQRRFPANSNSHLIGIVVADEISGNFYKEVFVRDRTGNGGIHLSFLFSNSGYFAGDSIRLDLSGLDVSLFSGMLEIDSIDHEKSVVKFGKGPAPQPKLVQLTALNAANPYSSYLCDLITINDVGFVPADTAKMWADAVGQLSVNRIIQDCAGNQITVRTSNYASFASEKTPKGFGSITGIATAYNSTNQMVIRHPKEVNMNGTGCVVYHKKDWNDNSLTSGGWSQFSVTNPSVMWTASTFGTDEFAKISGFVAGANTASENWLISPALNLSAASDPIFSFRTAAKFAGNALEVLVSTNYTSGNPSGATWSPLSGYTLSPNTTSYVWTNSGNLSLSAFKMSNVRIAFKYTSTTSGSTTYEVDDVIVLEN